MIIDLATASGATSRRIMRMQPLVLVPVVPDMNSVVSVSSIDAFFQHNSSQPGKPIQPYYILNPVSYTHLDVYKRQRRGRKTFKHNREERGHRRSSARRRAVQHG